MKFGEHLKKNIFSPWENEYIQYDKLKHFLKDRQQSFTGWMEADEDYFLEKLVIVDIDKVFEFINLKLRQIDSRLLDLQSSTGTKAEFETELTKIDELSRFIELNSTGFQKIIKKHDKWTSIDLSQHSKIRKSFQKFKSYQFRVGQLRNDINRKSLLIDFSNDIDFSLPENKKEEKPSFITSKYWIHPDHLNEVQAILLFHLPKQSKDAAVKPTHAVYFDNPSQFPLYSDLIQRKEGAETLCFKGCGSDVFVTRKTHRSSWTTNSESIVKDQFSLTPEQVDLFLSGQFPPNHAIAEHQKHDGAYATNTTYTDDLLTLSSSIYSLIHEKELKPTLRCTYHHTRYLAPHDPGLQVSLDTELMFVNEQQVRTHQKWKNLSKDVRELVPMQDERTVQRFPFSILEVKQQQGETDSTNTPEWLSQLIHGQLVHEVPFFSSYLHGASCFYRERLPLLPWWLNELTKDIKRPDPNDAIHEIHSAPQVLSKNNAMASLPPLSDSNYLDINFNDETKDHRIDMVSSPLKEKNALSPPLDRNGYGLGNEKVTDSSCTLTDDSLSRFGQHHADSTTGLLSHNVLSKSNIVTRIKNMKEQYYDNVFEESDKDDMTMMTWLSAKLTGKDLSSQTQEIMPKKGKPKKRIEPKIFFANERTFINWLQFSGLMLTLSLGLINFGDSVSKSSGGLFIFIAMFMAGYSLLRFQYRSWQIRMRSNSRFDDMWGPAVLCCVLIIALIVNLALRVNQPLPANPNLFGQDSDSVPFTNQTKEVNHTNNQAVNNHEVNIPHNQGIKNVTIAPHGRPIKANDDEDEED